MRISKLAEILNQKYDIRKLADSDDIQKIVSVIQRYESKSEFLGVFISALDAYLEKTIKEIDPVEGAEDIAELQQQISLIESGINSIINQVAELDEAWSKRQEVWLNDFKENK